LFVGRRVLIFKDPLHLQARLQGGAFIEEKKCLAAVSDKDDCGNLMYGFLSGMNASRSCKSLEVEINARLMSRAGSNIWPTVALRSALFGTTASRDKGNGASDGQPKRDFGTGNHSNRRCDRHIGHVERAGAAVEVLKVK